MMVEIPDPLAVSCSRSDERSAWLSQLPGLVRDLERRWRITTGAPFTGDDVSCSWVAPATLGYGRQAVLKVSMPHMEGEDEIRGLRLWNGDPTVFVLEADESAGAMLLERCEPGTSLRAVPEEEQDVVIAGLLRRMWEAAPAGDEFRPLSRMIEFWSEETLTAEQQWRDAELVREGLELFAELSRNTNGEVLLATDLHAGNVLRAQREPWLVIDPKPFAGDPAYDATQHLLNCRKRILSDPRGTISRFAGLLEVDEKRVALWTFARFAAEPRPDWANEELVKLARRVREIL